MGFDFLKKLDAPERQAKLGQPLTASERFKLINRTIRTHDLKGLTRYLCKLAGVIASRRSAKATK
ncbi:hypothetical protein B9T62_10870 [Paenibacillus donghaensis]|uniref:Uncharacterized protein n=1 Tax=Paenibacillus donghaensis TaxID=414771 RepID=A0A2Z2KDW9_9BACL|nr:hypothetical protein B9T62_10870 [Paenibacillus donghaensis]